jgi:thiamine-monophosphate kinase
MDISDGLVGDFGKLCRASGVAAEINVAGVPVSDAAKTVIVADPATLELVLTGGDDYEVICTVPNKKVDSFRAAAKAAGVPVTELGEIKAGGGVRFIDATGKPMVFKRTSFSHF